MLRHLELSALYDGEERAATRLRQHISWYGKSMGHIKPLKESIRLAPDFGTMVKAVSAAREAFRGSNLAYSDSGRPIFHALAEAGIEEISKVTCLDQSVE